MPQGLIFLGKPLRGVPQTCPNSSQGLMLVSQEDAHTNSSSALKNLKESKIIHNTMHLPYYGSPLRRRHIILHLVTTYCHCIPYTTPVHVRVGVPGHVPATTSQPPIIITCQNSIPKINNYTMRQLHPTIRPPAAATTLRSTTNQHGNIIIIIMY